MWWKLRHRPVVHSRTASSTRTRKVTQLLFTNIEGVKCFSSRLDSVLVKRLHALFYFFHFFMLLSQIHVCHHVLYSACVDENEMKTKWPLIIFHYTNCCLQPSYFFGLITFKEFLVQYVSMVASKHSTVKYSAVSLADICSFYPRRFILRGTWMFVPNLITVQLIVLMTPNHKHLPHGGARRFILCGTWRSGQNLNENLTPMHQVQQTAGLQWTETREVRVHVLCFFCC